MCFECYRACNHTWWQPIQLTASTNSSLPSAGDHVEPGPTPSLQPVQKGMPCLLPVAAHVTWRFRRVNPNWREKWKGLRESAEDGLPQATKVRFPLDEENKKMSVTEACFYSSSSSWAPMNFLRVDRSWLTYCLKACDITVASAAITTPPYHRTTSVASIAYSKLCTYHSLTKDLYRQDATATFAIW